MNEQELKKLKEQLDILKTEYIRLLNDKDVLINWGKPQLEALYNTRIGVFKLEVLKLQLTIKALKRKLELVRSAINNNLKIDVDEIELIIARELAHAEELIMIEANRVTESKNLLRNLDSPQRSSELRTVFRSLAKNLHPDVNAALTTEQKNIWHLVLEAYKHGDLDKLKALSLVYEKEIKGTENELNEEQITLAIESIKEGCKILQTDVAAIKSQFPFTIEKEIKDEEWVKNEIEKVNKDTATLKEYESELLTEYKTLIDLYE